MKKINKQFAKEFLFNVDDVFKKYNIVFWLDNGTLLGSMRERDFIEWDENDMDIGMYTPIFLNYKLWGQIIAELEKINIKIVYTYGDSVFQCKKSNGTDTCVLDVHTVKKVNKEYYIEMNTRWFFFPEEIFNQLDEIEFLGRKFKIPHNSEKYLTMLYGETWKEPHPEITIWTSKHCINFKNKAIYYTRYIPLFNEMIKGDKNV